MNWRRALKQLADTNTPHVLATILEVSGSAPRSIGTKMVVTNESSFDTVGGGGLEHQVVAQCRKMLSGGTTASCSNEIASMEINLARDAGQCCGGVVRLMLECFRPQYAPLVICGAGHVGCALVRILAEMPVTLTLLDTRDDWLQKAASEAGGANTRAASVTPVLLTQPHAQIEQCDQGSVFLIMTHSHDLDFELCEAVLSRPDNRCCGLIASRSKAASFKRRLMAKGFGAQELAALLTPVGLPEVAGKEPMSVAVSIVAQLLSLPAFNTSIEASTSGAAESKAAKSTALASGESTEQY